MLIQPDRPAGASRVQSARASLPYLAARLARDPGEAVVEAWVVRRRTLLAIERERVIAAAHLLDYGVTTQVGPAFRNAGEVAWLVAWPSACEAAEAVLTAGLSQLADWGTEPPFLCTGSLFVPTVSGISDTWPHIAAIVRAAGFAPEPEREEVLYAGSWLVRSAAPYMHLAGCHRMLVSVAADDERAGAGRFYERLGLVRLARLERAWRADDRAQPAEAATG
jgi:hypothetical protein